MDGDRQLRIKEWAAEDRPREKMLLKGASTLSNAELLAILIGSGSNRETALQLAQRILSSVSNDLHSLSRLSVKELMTFKGIGMAKAVSIVTALEMGRRKGVSEPLRRDQIQSSRDAFNLFYPLVCDLTHEELWVAVTNRAGRVIEKVKVSQGGVSETVADLQLIMKVAINTLCSGVLLCHNHPSGNLRPSVQDDLLTDRLEKAAQLMQIKLLDHLIIAGNHYYSYADEGRLGK